MKILGGFLSAVLLVSLTPAAMAAEPVKTSKLFGFKGRYRGTVNYASIFTGTTVATVTASKRSEVGKITLNSFLSGGGSAAALLETLTIRSRRGIYSIQIAGDSGFGSGRVVVSKNVIRYTVPFIASSGGSFVVNGTITKTPRRLAVFETLSGAVNFSVSYSLRRQGR